MPFGKRGSRCCCEDDCCEDCNACEFTVTISGFYNGNCDYCTNLDGSYSVSTAYACDTSSGSAPFTGNGICGGTDQCGCVFYDEFSISDACTQYSDGDVAIQVVICCDLVQVTLIYDFSSAAPDYHTWRLTKTNGDYAGCDFSSTDIPWFSQQGTLAGVKCLSKKLIGTDPAATCLLTANC